MDLEGLAHPIVQRQQIGAVFVRPGFLGTLAHQFLQASKAARLGKAQRIGLDERIIVHELIIEAHFGGVVVAGTTRVTLAEMLLAPKYLRTLTRLLPSCT